jgi:hypothetical protein
MAVCLCFVWRASHVVFAVCCAEYEPDLQPVDKYNRPAIYYAASWFGLEGVKLLLQEGCPLPEGGLPRLVEMLRCHPPLAKVSVGDPASGSKCSMSWFLAFTGVQ